MLQSIRRRLPFSYAAIALLAALVLGAILLMTLQSYYGGLERDYLARYGSRISNIAGEMLNASLTQDTMKAQFTSLPFLSQTRMRRFHDQLTPVVDSNTPNSRDVLFSYTCRVSEPGDTAVKKPLAPCTSILILQNRDEAIGMMAGSAASILAEVSVSAGPDGTGARLFVPHDFG